MLDRGRIQQVRHRPADGAASVTFDLPSEYEVHPNAVWVCKGGSPVVMGDTGERIAILHFDDAGIATLSELPGIGQRIGAIWSDPERGIVRTINDDWSRSEYEFTLEGDMTRTKQWLKGSSLLTSRRLLVDDTNDRTFVGSYCGWVSAFDSSRRTLLWTKPLTPVSTLPRAFRFGELAMSPDASLLFASANAKKVWIL
ncbi:MAG: hypothetical protein AAF802_12130, partial [Planctomycetota bacterium]